MKTLKTLVPDMYSLFGSDKEPSQENLDALMASIREHVKNTFKKRIAKGELRASTIGAECDRKSWYLYNTPEDAEDIEPNVKFKFLYGHILEDVALFLAAEAGHTISLQQEEVDVGGIKGHLDGVIDGVLVDSKSANSRGMDKFRMHKLEHDDPFGYMAQLDFYREGLKGNPAVIDKDKVAFIAIDKELGHIVLDVYERTEDHSKKLNDRVEHKKKVVQLPTPPKQYYTPVADGKSGNLQLDVPCRYCEFKHKCWASSNGGRGLRTFIYSSGPRFLTTVVREPDVKEVPK